MSDILVTYKENVKKIKLFDILVQDIHANDNYETIDSTVALTYHEVWEWISEGGDWGFKVTEHKNPENVFMTGLAIQNMNNARKGKSDIVLGHATEQDINEIHEDLHQKTKQRLGIIYY